MKSCEQCLQGNQIAWLLCKLEMESRIGVLGPAKGTARQAGLFPGHI